MVDAKHGFGCKHTFSTKLTGLEATTDCTTGSLNLVEFNAKAKGDYDRLKDKTEVASK